MQALVGVLAPDVVLIADGGGLVATAPKPIIGAEKVLAVVAAAKFTDLAATTAWLNGTPGARVHIDGYGTTALSLAVDDGNITRIYAISNPHKLRWLEKVADLRR